MPDKKHKRLKKAVPVAGVVGVSMALAGGGSAAAAPTKDMPMRDAIVVPPVTFSEE